MLQIICLNENVNELLPYPEQQFISHHERYTYLRLFFDSLLRYELESKRAQHMNVDWHPYDDPFQRAMNIYEYRYHFFSFSDYLKTIAIFVENERKKNDQQIDDIKKKITSGEIEVEEGEEYYYYAELEDGFPEFENALFSSFFVMIYSHMESELKRYCRDLEKRDPQRVKRSDLADKNELEKSMNYLIKVQQIQYEKSPVWARIKSLQYLRNCIIHNQGKLDDVNKRDELLKLFKIRFEDEICILDKDFCSDSLDTMEKFLNSVAAAKKPKAP